MSKLRTEDQFLDLSDYGRSFGKLLAKSLQETKFTPIHVTLLFGVCGLLSISCMLSGDYITAALLLLLKSGIDAADGELARLKKTPSYTGRYLDSVFDIVLNFMFLSTIAYIVNADLLLLFAAFFGMQLQGTLYNYYYVILRNRSVGGDATSKIFENKTPKALPGESQKAVNILFKIYLSLYGIFDKIIYSLDAKAHKAKKFPNWFMTCLSVYGLGFQLLLIAVLLATNNISYVLPVIAGLTFPVFLVVIVRKTFIK
jgi:phosphatidylglycerophosphate synthase